MRFGSRRDEMELSRSSSSQQLCRTGIEATGIMPPPPPEPKPDVPILVLVARCAPTPVESAAAEPAPTTLPKTASDLPLIGLLGVFFCGISLGQWRFVAQFHGLPAREVIGNHSLSMEQQRVEP